ncbi:Bug family tripartite tricarboxylate transporter substrate binding protein [Achromobacter aloeverae]|nr:tripartite tricarboxylate transporter substrate binding protein [Achromobacter aloeverae]
MMFYESSRRAFVAAAARYTGLVAALAMALVPFPAAHAAGYPDRPIRLVVPIAAGSATDAVARAYAQELAPILGQPIIVENLPGANGTIGTSNVKRAPADGYTLLLGTIGTHSVNPLLYKNLPYDAVKDYTPVSILSKVSNVIVVPATSPYRTLQDLVAAAKKAPHTLNYGTPTVGSSSQLATEMFRVRAGIDLANIPYNGPSQAAIDLIADRIQVLFDPVINELGNIRSGKVRVLAQTASQRVPALPDVPTVAQAGYPGFEASGWNGIMVRAGTPAAVVEKLSAAIRQAGQSQKLRTIFEGQGVEIVTSPSPQDFNEFLVQDRKKWARVIEESHIAVE